MSNFFLIPHLQDRVLEESRQCFYRRRELFPSRLDVRDVAQCGLGGVPSGPLASKGAKVTDRGGRDFSGRELLTSYGLLRVRAHSVNVP